jgi:hypothetical protein
MNTVFSDDAMYTLIDETYATIEQDGLRDWHKYRREDNSWFVAGPDELKAFVSDRRRFLLDEMTTYCPADRLYLAINEIMPDNRSTLEAPDAPGAFPAWFELYNGSLETADLSGLYLTDDPAVPTRSRIPDGVTIPPGGFVTFFADGAPFDTAQGEPERGPLHTSFALDQNGGQIAIFSGTLQLNSHTFGPQPPDVSTARYPDGVDHWRPFASPTPGSSNLLHPPTISTLSLTPPLPAASDTVTVTATITDDGSSLTVTLRYRVDESDAVSVPMSTTHADQYVASIPPLPAGSLVTYQVTALDDDGQTSSSPHADYLVDYVPPTLFINEVMADNETTLSDGDGFPDWIELYNPGSSLLDLSGRYLTDNLDNPTKFQIPPGVTIPPGGFLLLYADNRPDLGPLHTNFRLNRNGEAVGLFDTDATAHQPIDVIPFGSQPADVSTGRCPDGDTIWVPFSSPTPGGTNAPCGSLPYIAAVHHQPSLPSAADQVTITATIVPAAGPITPTLWYDAGTGFVSIPMTPTAQHTCLATIPPQPEAATVAYYVQVHDDRGIFITDPLPAPLATHQYTVDYQPPTVLINELMANNATIPADPSQPWAFPDWIELYNPGSSPVDLGGKYLTDDLTNPTRFRIPDGITIPAGDFVLFFADGAPERGPFHTNFRLSRNGESVGLYETDAAGNQPIDTHTFGPQAAHVSECRQPDGSHAWTPSCTPSPGESNTR